MLRNLILFLSLFGLQQWLVSLRLQAVTDTEGIFNPPPLETFTLKLHSKCWTPKNQLIKMLEPPFRQIITWIYPESL